MLTCLALIVTGSSALCQPSPPHRPSIGMWLTVWWTSDDQYKHWVHCHRLPTVGRYTEGDPKIIEAQYQKFRDIGVDFIIMDDTNGYGNDGGRIKDNIRAWFDYMDRKPEAARIPICIGGGGEMRDGGGKLQQQAADFYWKEWAVRPSYFKLNGKPLLLIDTDKNYGPADFNDARFTVRWAYNGDNHAAMLQNKTWGWGSYEPSPILEECMSIWPGHCFPVNVEKQGSDPVEQAREGGDLYVRMWLRVMQAHPQFVTIADWNNFEEESAIEDSYSWTDARGYTVPDLYVRITRAYSRLRNGKFVKGEYYREVDKQEVYHFDGERMVHQGAMPVRAAVIVVPVGALVLK